MILLDKDIPYNKLFTFSTFENSSGRHLITFSKSIDIDQNRYYLKLTNINNKRAPIREGYIYFYLDREKLSSEFIGMYINEKFRGEGYASELLASWVELCLSNDYMNLATIKKQRKPFLLYMLKLFDFEISNPDLYDTSRFTISLYHKENDQSKYIYFRNLGHENNSFIKSSIVKKDNYVILNDKPEEDYVFLDDVLLSRIYYLQNPDNALKEVTRVRSKR